MDDQETLELMAQVGAMLAGLAKDRDIHAMSVEVDGRWTRIEFQPLPADTDPPGRRHTARAERLC